MAYTIFMSYSQADGPWVQWIRAHTSGMGIPTYMYEHDPQPGHYISEKVKAQIAASNAVVVLLTLNSQASAYVQQEIGCAEGLGKLIIPLVHPNVSPQTLAMLAGREYISFDFEQPQTALQALLTYLERLRQQQLAKETAETAKLALLSLGSLLLAAWGAEGADDDGEEYE